MKPVGVLRFLGTNCDFDIINALKDLSIPCEFLWWRDHFELTNYSAFILPGGFSYGDYLRAGALAAKTPAMDDVKKAADKGYPVLGICNGFQILCEAGLLPGALTKNLSRQFQEQWVEMDFKGDCKFTPQKKGSLKIPMAHSMGRFVAPEDTLKSIQDSGQIWLTYRTNPNGSTLDIAGLANKAKNVAALMPHPERAMHSWMGSTSGRCIFETLV